MPDPDSSSNQDAIEAAEVTTGLTRQLSTTNPEAPAKHTGMWLWIGFVFLLALAVYVIFLLPNTFEYQQPDHQTDNDLSTSPSLKQIPATQPATPEQSTIAKIPEQPDSAEEADQLQLKAQAEQLLSDIIALESDLDKHAVKKWAAEKYAQATEQGRIGDEYFRRGQYRQATGAFQNAVKQLQDLHDRIELTLEQALLRGEQALMQGDRVAAVQQFELAKAIAPNNVRASNSLQRAQTIEELFILLQRGSRFESHGQLQQAKSTYQQAVQLDALSDEAKSALKRVNSKLIQQEFDQLIASGYQALQNGQYADARAAFNAAKQLSPAAKESSIGLNKVAEAVKNEKIENLLYEADHFEQLEQWQQAATSYEKVLKLDSSHSVAQQGLHASTAKAKILADLQQALELADHLHQENVLAQAQQVLAAVSALTSSGDTIEQRSQELQQLVRVATTPVSIVLESDNKTEVIVYKVARLGTFGRRILQLRPGPYTIVGTRVGYRDVRKSIKITPESHNTTLSIFCEEPI